MQVVGIPLLKTELASITIPDISGSINIAVGDVSYDVSKYVKFTCVVSFLRTFLNLKLVTKLVNCFNICNIYSPI